MRTARKESTSGIYHVMMRGNNHQDIFKNDMDKKYFIYLLKKYLVKLNLELYAWCLMNNHFHLVIKASKKNLADFIKRVCCSYVPYFNRKYERSGHLFQDRYKSEPIETDQYFMGAIRYVHNNPEKANICARNTYKWSSYREYIISRNITSTEKLLSMLGGKKSFVEYSKQKDSSEYLENKQHIWDNQASKIINLIYKHYKITNLINCKTSLKKQLIDEFLQKGLSISQIVRITHFSRNMISKCLRL